MNDPVVTLWYKYIVMKILDESEAYWNKFVKSVYMCVCVSRSVADCRLLSHQAALVYVCVSRKPSPGSPQCIVFVCVCV